MPAEALAAALSVLEDYPGIGVLGSGPEGAVLPEDQDPELSQLLVRYHTRFRFVPDRASIAAHRVSKLAIVDLRGIDPDLPARLDEALGAAVRAVTSGHESVDLIVAGRHIHMSPDNAAALNLKDQDRVSVRFGGERGARLDNFLIRVKDSYLAELHLDTDEGNAVGARTGDYVTICLDR